LVIAIRGPICQPGFPPWTAAGAAAVFLNVVTSAVEAMDSVAEAPASYG
jgi:hypothetical protein